MFHYKSVKQLLVEERRKREAAQATALKSAADVEYVAMMCDVELDNDNLNSNVEEDDK